MATSESCDVNIENEFRNLAKGAWQCWADFERDLSQFEKNTATAHRLERSDLVTSSNIRRQRLGQPLIPEAIKYTRAVYVCCHYGDFKSKSTGQKNAAGNITA